MLFLLFVTLAGLVGPVGQARMLVMAQSAESNSARISCDHAVDSAGRTSRQDLHISHGNAYQGSRAEMTASAVFSGISAESHACCPEQAGHAYSDSGGDANTVDCGSGSDNGSCGDLRDCAIYCSVIDMGLVPAAEAKTNLAEFLSIRFPRERIGHINALFAPEPRPPRA